jgi:2-aminoadipate transaminase
VPENFDYTDLLRPNLPPPATPWNGFPKYNFVGGHNDAASVPVEHLITAASSVLRREGQTLASYGLQSGALGYRPLREFLSRKLAKDAGIACSPDEILITAGSLQGLDLVN